MKRLALLALLFATPAAAEDTQIESVTVNGRSLAGVWHGTLVQSGFRSLLSNLAGVSPLTFGQMVPAFCRIAPLKNDLEMSCMHQEVGTYASQRGIEHLLTLGDATRETARAFGEGARICATVEQLCDALATIEAKSVLIKGSRFMRMERVVQDYLKRFGVVPEGLVNHAV